MFMVRKKKEIGGKIQEVYECEVCDVALNAELIDDGRINVVRRLREKLSEKRGNRKKFALSVSARGEELLKLLLGDDADLLPLELSGVEHAMRGDAVTLLFRGRLTKDEIEVVQEKRIAREAKQVGESKPKEDGDD